MQTENSFDNIKCTNPKPWEFCVFVPWACTQIALEYDAVITKTTKLIDRRAKQTPQTCASVSSEIESESCAASEIEQIGTMSFANVFRSTGILKDNNVHITAEYEGEHLVTLKIVKNERIPKSLFYIINMTMEFHPLLNRIILDGVDEIILLEIKNLLNNSNITEVYLDTSYVPQGNYHVLLDCENCRVLSLSMCTITDVDVESMAKKLSVGTTGCANLMVLNLATNLITDVGAKYLADMLRTNRTLVYLNLAHNQISDDGARYILEVLREFPVTEDEVNASIRRQAAFKTKTLHLMLSMLDSASISSTPSIHRLKHRKVATEATMNKLDESQSKAKSCLGENNDPFSARNTIRIGEVVHCRGNYTLRHLNLAYNSLTYLSVKLILDVLTIQRKMLVQNDTPGGLLNIRINGNNITKRCMEYDKIDDFLRCSREIMFGNKKKTTTFRKSDFISKPKGKINK